MTQPLLTTKRSWWLLILIPVAIFIQSCGDSQAEQPKTALATAPANPAIPADGFIVKPTSFSEEIEITGTLVANQEVTVASELLRKVVQVHAKEGNYVGAGTLLFQLDDADLQAQLERLRQQEKLAALNEARLKDLIEHDAAVQQDYDQAMTNLNVLKAEIRALAVTIDKTRIRAPFNGRIGIVRVYTGALVSPNTVLTNIVDDTKVKIEFAVPEKYANLVTIGKAQRFTVESDTVTYAAIVVAKESKMNDQTRTLLVEAIGANPHGKLVSGQSARLVLALHTSNDALKVPSQALMPSAQGYAVYVAHNNKVQLAPVEIGQRGDLEVQILKGLNKGDTVITSNILRLMPGAAVSLVKVQ
jgi:membrane fusion protein (multidrug efflux system)